MKRLLIGGALAASLLAVYPASAWMYWYHMPAPYSPTQTWYMSLPGMYLYNQIPSGMGQTWYWHLPIPTSGFYVEQGQVPGGYRYRVHAAGQRLQDINISVAGGVLSIRQTGGAPSLRQGMHGPLLMQQFGGYSQWLILPPDANPDAMRAFPQDGVLEIVIPRRR